MEQRSSDYDSSRRDIPSFIEPRPPLIQNPFMRPRPQKGLNLMEQFEEDSEMEEPELVQVYLRMKPCHVPTNLYEVKSNKCLVTSMDTTSAGHGRRTQHNVSRMYTFSRIFNTDSNQKEIFEQVVKENLKKLPDGQNFTLLTYGASGSGKTYTLMGTVNSPGLVPRSLEYVFKLVDVSQMPIYKPSDKGADQLGYAQQDFELQWVSRLRQVSAPQRDKYRRMSALMRNDLTTSNFDLSNRTKYYVWVSFVEIYNEAIYDLLATPDKRVKLRIREDSSGNVYVKGVTQAFVRSGEEAYDVMVAGKHNLVVAATGVHAHSSRSHCIFTITMLTENEGEIRTSHVRLCDLAGCERQRAARNTGARMQESRAINSSLHVLERCLHMLRRKQKLTKETSLVPYRESKLTRLLGSGLSGSRGEVVSMVVTLNPAPQYAHETKHVLSLAAVAQDIQINNTMYASTLSTLESSTQDTTICTSAEVMKLRADNERLHFELVQAQGRNKELLASMEETQHQTANTMRELVEETKDMMRQYYEAQIHSLKSKMDDMTEEYESRLAMSAAPAEAAAAGTPSRYLQTKVAQLMTAITVLEDKISKETLARARAEKEVQHLRTCIEERDEKAYHETAEEEETEDEEAVLVDSEHESDEDSPDPFNESLEPVFKKECMNRSHVVHIKRPINIEASKVEIMDDTIEETIENDENKSIDDKSDDSSKRDESVIMSKDSLYATGDEESGVVDERTRIENTLNSITNVTQNFNDVNDKEISNRIDETDISCLNVTHTDKDKSECEELFNESTKLPDEKPDEISSNLRGTYFVKNDVSQKEHLKEDLKGKNINAVRGTYYVEEPDSFSYNPVDIDDATLKNKANSNEIRPTKVSETLVSKIIKSLKTSQGSDSSLTQFEQLEMAADNVDNSKDKSKDFVDLKVLKKKKKYFDDTINEITNTEAVINAAPAIENLLVESVKCEINLVDPLVNVTKQDKYFEHKTNDSKYDHLSSAAKIQNKQLYFDDHENTSHIMTTVKNQEKTSYFETKTDENKSHNMSNAAKIQEKQLYFNAKDKSSYDDVILSRSGEKLKRFDRIAVNADLVCNKKVNDVIFNSQKDAARSPSIVKDDLGKDYEPSRAVMKLLGESFTKPELLPSIHKNKVNKKHESVDIFESPQTNIARAPEIGEIEKKFTANAERTEDIIDTAPVARVKELSNVEIVRKSIERLVLEQKTKADVKHEIKLQPASFEESVTDDLQEYQCGSNENQGSDKIVVTVTSDQTPDESQTNENNTVDEFDNIYKDLSNTRATEFELLVSHDVDTTNVKEKTIEPDSHNLTNIQEKIDKVVSEETKIFEETKYSLRNREKSTIKRSLRLRRRKNQDDESSDQDTEGKLKDIVNLKKEFSDVTLGLPAMKKEMKDIPSPEKLPGEENLPPMMGIHSCPSKSVTRSRRKLFTPRAEPLDESSCAGDSNERINVPRPSYHRTRTRRKL